MKFGETIPKGFVIEVTSWENDGDNYKTVQQTGISTEYMNVVKRLAPLFRSRCNNRGCFGNTCEGEVVPEILVEAVQVVLKDLNPEDVYKVLDYDIMSIDFENEDFLENQIEEAADAISEFVRDEMLGSSEFYDFRVIERVIVYYLPEDVIIPSVTKIVDMTF